MRAPASVTLQVRAAKTIQTQYHFAMARTKIVSRDADRFAQPSDAFIHETQRHELEPKLVE